MQNVFISCKEHSLNLAAQLYDNLSACLQRQQISSDGAEIHGLLCGMLGGGMPLDNRDWPVTLADFIHQGQTLPEELVSLLQQLLEQTISQLLEGDFGLVLLLPDDSAPINERGQALIQWVHGFMLGFGLHQADLTRCSADVKEALEDFAEIARMDEEMVEDEASEQALFEVYEYVRISAMLCFNELGQSDNKPIVKSKTLH